MRAVRISARWFLRRVPVSGVAVLAIAGGTAVGTSGPVSAVPSGLATRSSAQERAPAAVVRVHVGPRSPLWVNRDKDVYAGNSVGVSPDGTLVFVAGGLFDYETFAYRVDTGYVVWHADYSGGSGVSPYLRVSPDGTKVFVAGSGASGGYVVVAYDAGSGAQLWSAIYQPPGGGGIPLSIAVSPDATKVFVTGYAYSPGTKEDITTVSFDANSGRLQWVATYDGPAHGTDVGWAMAVSPDGSRVFVAGSSEGIGNDDDDAVTVAYDAVTGSQEWASRYYGTHFYNTLASVAVSPDGAHVYVAGNSQRGFNGQHYLTIAYAAATGIQEWVSIYEGPGDNLDFAYAVLPSRNGKLVYVTGSSSGSGGLGVVGTIAYNALTGRKAWVAQFSVQGQILNWGCCLALDSSGSTLFVAGTTSWSGYDYLTLSYNAQDGVLNWASHYGGIPRGYDSVSSLAVSRGPTARGTLVFVTGLSEEHQGTNGMVTLAYAAGS